MIASDSANAGRAVAAGELARSAAKRFLRLDVPPFLIALPGTALGGCSFLFPWRFARPSAGVPEAPTHVLPHEIGHALFIRFVIPRTRSDQYASDAPDWLDEMAAVAFEDPEGVISRRAEARRHAERGDLIPLARLLSMPHPEWAAGISAPVTTMGSPVTAPASSETPAFYATVRALLDFLVDRTRDEGVVRTLADRARAGVPLDRWILAHAGTGAAEDLAGLDAEIRHFVLTEPMFGGAQEVPHVSQ